MRRVLSAWLRRIAGDDLAKDILGDVAESGGGLGRIAAIACGITVRHTADALGAIIRLGSPRGAAKDLHYATRTLRRTPWYAAATIGVIALSMALATTVFAVVDGVLFKPLPSPHDEQLYAIQPGFTKLARADRRESAGPVDLAAWSAAAPGASITGFRAENWLIADSPTGSYGVGMVGPNFFDVIGVRPLFGGFAASDFDAVDSTEPKITHALISFDVWQSRFLGRGDVAGQRIVADRVLGTGYRVVGVMPEGFGFPVRRGAVQLIVPDALSRAALIDPRRHPYQEVVARMPQRNASILRAQVEAGMRAVADVFPAPTQEDAARGRSVLPYDRADIVPLTTAMGERDRPLFAAIFFAAAILVSLGAVNVSGLLAARYLDRARELGLRRALGANGFSVARLVMAESLVVTGAGCAAGLVLSPWLLRLGLDLLPDNLMLIKTPAIDLRVAGFSAVAALALALLASAWPIRRALRVPSGLVADGVSVTGRRRSPGRFIVVTSQIAGAAVLCVVGGLFVTSTLALYARSPNVRTDDVLSVVTVMSGDGDRATRVRAVLDRLREIPGVTSASGMSLQALNSGPVRGWFNPPPDAPDPTIGMVVSGVTSNFYDTVGLQLVAGRFPAAEQIGRDDPVIVIGEGLSRAYFGGASPVGRTLTLGPDLRPFTISGVVKDVRWMGMDIGLTNIYGPYALLPQHTVGGFYLRVSGDVVGVQAQVGAAIERTDPFMQVLAPETLAERFADSIRARRLQAWLFGAFASAALAIVGVGILGLMAMSVAGRSREIGIRMALGSTSSGVLSLLMREQAAAVGAGLLMGGGIAAWAVRFFAWSLYDVGVFDLRIWAVSIGAIVLAAVVGTLVPSMRGSRVDPLRALRVE
jgi:predicted permease